MKRNRGFTIVELLIVVGIIGVLIAVMMPAMLKARQASNLAQCQANLRQIGQAASFYAVDNRDCLPPPFESGLSPFRSATFNFTAATFYDTNRMVDRYYYPPLSGRSRDPGANLFRLQLTGYLGAWTYKVNGLRVAPTARNVRLAAGDADYFPVRFCPGQMPSANFAGQYQSSYLFNPHWIAVEPNYYNEFTDAHPTAGYLPNSPAQMQSPPVTVWYRRLTDYPRNAVLCSDMIATVPLAAHPAANGRQATWNLLFADGHVQAVLDQYVLSGLAQTPAAATYADPQGEIKGPPSPATMQTLDDYLDILETEAQGRHPLQTNFYPTATYSNQATPLKNREVDVKKNVFAWYF